MRSDKEVTKQKDDDDKDMVLTKKKMEALERDVKEKEEKLEEKCRNLMELALTVKECEANEELQDAHRVIIKDLARKPSLIVWMFSLFRQEAVCYLCEGATKFLFAKLKDLQLYVPYILLSSQSVVLRVRACTMMRVVFAYYKEGSTDPIFLYFAYGLMEVKC
ncbi:hypothetical protein Ddye_022804 [Dipteronia dyeriana]|uniref:Uncharacterized protein n=1 Tax=Dipteronia dyeriana TaxID=168575 RepID=A0AAD9WRS6_9ROSI|nr:hypothetical protein Ddye_022804 [Dipteronia dyeriana]